MNRNLLALLAASLVVTGCVVASDPTQEPTASTSQAATGDGDGDPHDGAPCPTHKCGPAPAPVTCVDGTVSEATACVWGEAKDNKKCVWQLNHTCPIPLHTLGGGYCFLCALPP